MKTSLSPYLFFNGNCQEAFDFYKSVFGGEFQMISQYKDTPPQEGMPVPDDYKEKLMHISLNPGNGFELHGSDSHPGMPPVIMGTQFSLTIDTDDKDEATRIFNALVVGGKVNMPLTETFWGAYFGMLVDKFGFMWMISHQMKK